MLPPQPWILVLLVWPAEAGTDRSISQGVVAAADRMNRQVGAREAVPTTAHRSKMQLRESAGGGRLYIVPAGYTLLGWPIDRCGRWSPIMPLPVQFGTAQAAPTDATTTVLWQARSNGLLTRNSMIEVRRGVGGACRRVLPQSLCCGAGLIQYKQCVYATQFLCSCQPLVLTERQCSHTTTLPCVSSLFMEGVITLAATAGMDRVSLHTVSAGLDRWAGAWLPILNEPSLSKWWKATGQNATTGSAECTDTDCQL